MSGISRYPVDIHWITTGYPVNIHWISWNSRHFLPVDIQWISWNSTHFSPVDIQWMSTGYPVDIHWISWNSRHFSPVDIQWTSNGYIHWISSGIIDIFLHWISINIPQEFQGDSTFILVELQFVWGFKDGYMNREGHTENNNFTSVILKLISELR